MSYVISMINSPDRAGILKSAVKKSNCVIAPFTVYLLNWKKLTPSADVDFIYVIYIVFFNGELALQIFLYIKSVFLVCVREVLVLRVLCNIVLVRLKRSHAAKL